MYIHHDKRMNFSATKYGYKNIENYVSLVHPRLYIMICIILCTCKIMTHSNSPNIGNFLATTCPRLTHSVCVCVCVVCKHVQKWT